MITESQSTASVESSDLPPLSPEFASARILVVDDQPANINAVGVALSRFGCEIISATDGMSALKQVAQTPPDLILLDLLMPIMSGCDVCREIKANPAWKDIPVIFLSAADDKDLIVSAFDSGGVDYITKPFNQAELVSRVRTQLALKAAQDRLKQLAEDKDELMGILTHDLKSCLGGLNMTAGLLCERIVRLNDNRLQQLSENIFRSSAQALAFVREFLANAAADHGFVPRITTFDVTEVLSNTMDQYLDAARRKQINFQIDIPDEPILVRADASALTQVFDNLLSNAVKFSPNGKSVFVSLQKKNDQIAECIVRDEGPGFSDEDKKHMFRRYVRLSARPTGGEPSTGLGLSIVFKLVQAMQAELVCESTPGQGAAFMIRLPRSS
jgi:two-component system, sensor histidine kinase and response regulator